MKIWKQNSKMKRKEWLKIEYIKHVFTETILKKLCIKLCMFRGSLYAVTFLLSGAQQSLLNAGGPSLPSDHHHRLKRLQSICVGDDVLETHSQGRRFVCKNLHKCTNTSKDVYASGGFSVILIRSLTCIQNLFSTHYTCHNKREFIFCIYLIFIARTGIFTLHL